MGLFGVLVVLFGGTNTIFSRESSRSQTLCL